MQKFVLDCSATMAYFFKDETSTYVDSAIESLGADGIAYVPPNWSQEIVNTCLNAIRRKRITEQEVKRIYKILASSKEFVGEIWFGQVSKCMI